MVFSFCQQDNQFSRAILAVWPFASYDNFIVCLKISLWHSWLKNGSRNNIFELSFSAWICSERGERCARKRRKSEVSLCRKVVQKRGKNVESVFKEKLLRGKNFVLSLWRVKRWPLKWCLHCVWTNLAKWKVVTHSRNVPIGLEIGDGIMLRFVFICDNWQKHLNSNQKREWNATDHQVESA